VLILHESPPARNGLLMTTGTPGRLPGSRRGVAVEHEIGQMSIHIDATLLATTFLLLRGRAPHSDCRISAGTAAAAFHKEFLIPMTAFAR
jgi:hypothetical protein